MKANTTYKYVIAVLLAVIITVLICASASAANTYTTHWRIAKPATGDLLWGDTLNDNGDTVDDVLYQLYIGDILDDALSDTTIDWGTGTAEVNAADVPILDSAGYTGKTTVETALAEIYEGAINADGVADTQIDWGTGTAQVGAADVPIADAGTHFITDVVESALQQVGENLAADGISDTQVDWGSGTGQVDLSDIPGSGTLVDPVDGIDLGDTVVISKMLYAKTGRGASFFIASNDATDTDKAQADFLCDGTADDVQINAAIGLLPAYGGEIRLSSGRFTLSDTIILDNDPGWGTSENIVITGAGMNVTILYPAAASNDYIFGIPEGEKHWITIRDLSAGGNGPNAVGVEANTAGGFLKAYDGRDMNFERLWLYDFSDTVIDLALGWGNRIEHCIMEFSSKAAVLCRDNQDLQITNCKIIDNYGPAIVLAGATTNNGGYAKIMGNVLGGGVLDADPDDGYLGAYALEIRAEAPGNCIIGNEFRATDGNAIGNGNDNACIYIGENNQTIIGNFFGLSTTIEQDGIYIASGTGYCTILGNTFKNSAPGGGAEVIDNDAGNSTNLLGPNMNYGVVRLFGNANASINQLQFGALGSEFDIDFQTGAGSNDYARMVLGVNHASQGSGYLSIVSGANRYSANMAVGLTTNPTIRTFSGADHANKYIDIYHDQTYGKISGSNVDGNEPGVLINIPVNATAPTMTAGYDTGAVYIDSDVNAMYYWNGATPGAWVLLDGAE
jgi:hypothetical protein